MSRPLAVQLASMLLFSVIPIQAQATCDECKDLCRLIDGYQQREKGIELWRQYAFSNPNRKAPPAGVTDANSMEKQVEKEFIAWTTTRKLPCPPKKRSGGAVEVDLTTSIDSDCTISYKGKPLEGQTLTDYQTDKGCQAEADATIAHEEVHRMHCLKAYSEDPAGASALLDRPEMVSESELQAWTAQQKVLVKAIRALLAKKGCGWEPTYHQRASGDAIPSQKQLDDMRNRAWQAAKALSKKARP